jgi:Cof subfamily protein (haloacid dehalogenase superfamily)
MIYRMVVADLDGTLKSESATTFTPRVRQTVAGARARGVHVVLATGRMFQTAEPFARDLQLADPTICDHGATIWDLHEKQLIFDKRIPPDLLRQVAGFADGNLTLTACADGELYTNRIDPDAPGDPYTLAHLHLISDFASLPSQPQKLLFLNDEATTDGIFPKIRTRFSSSMQVVRSSTRRVELTHLVASKGVAAAWLAARWDIPREQVIAIGDQDNDRSMIEWAGLGIAMGNAIESVRAIADFVAPSAEEDGAAVAIERFVLREA